VQIERGYISPQFVTSNEKLLVGFSNVRVLVMDQKITTTKEIIPVLEKTTQMNMPLLITCPAEGSGDLRTDRLLDT
jgi:chaperonin GroEL (HSP60 family)